MSVYGIVGGQYGGEGKGKIISFLDWLLNPDIIAKAGGPNSGHRVVTDKFDYTFRCIPSHVRVGKVKFYLGAGTLINVNILKSELMKFNCSENIYIDFNAGIIEEKHINLQKSDSFYENAGSTYQGSGTASAERCLRRLALAGQCNYLKKYLCDMGTKINIDAKNGKTIFLEGSQSFGLSNYHGNYPFCTSRDAIIAALCSQIGIGIKNIDKIILVVKCYPSRNHKGRLENELSIDQILKLNLTQRNVDGIIRRIGKIDFNLIKRAAIINSATDIALTGVDLYDNSNSGCTALTQLSPKTRELIDNLENACNIPVSIISTGIYYNQAICLI